MIKLLNVSDLSHDSHLEEEVRTYTLESLTFLDEEYGEDRDLITELGGYIAIVEHPVEIMELDVLHNIDLTKNPCPECGASMVISRTVNTLKDGTKRRLV